jgi:long-chain-fatty-acid--[acyl-carrier-protein] ligase
MLMQLLRWMSWLLVRVLVLGRYRATILGKQEVLRRPGPYLMLPNHPAFIDPPLLMAFLWPTFRFRPMLLETNFQNPILAPFVPILRAIPIPDIERASAADRQRVEEAVGAAVAALRAGDNVIVWPSGRLQRNGIESIGGSRSVADILAAVPNVTVVLVRTRGLWGSMFSVAATGQRPHLMALLFRSVLLYLANLIIFTPRRHITIKMEPFTRAERPEPTREAVNHWLEAWYNADVRPEKPTYVPHHFLFGPRAYEFPPPPSLPEVDVRQVKPETKQVVAEALEEKLGRPLTPEEERPNLTFRELGLDSLDLMEVTLTVERRTGFHGESIPVTLGQLWALAAGLGAGAPVKPPPPVWFSPPTGALDVVAHGQTVAEAVVNRVLMNPRDIATADDVGGILTYEQILMRSLLLASRFRDIPEPHVGLLMPASSAGVVALMALHFAGKLPVLLNWTTGPGNMGHGVEITGVKRVVTSKLFIDRAQVVVPGAEFLYLESVRGTVGRLEYARRWLAMKLFRTRVARRTLARLDPDPDKPAAVLFTSGSEKAPKAVPLTHRNVLSDMAGAAPLLQVDRTTVLLVFLPLFHSFGHTVTGLFPLFGGIKSVYHPDPTDASGLVRKIVAYRPTALAATPTFLGYILDRAEPGDLDSLQLIVVGAEKCPDVIFDKAAKLAPNATVVEGYGITECSPVVSANPRWAPKRGTVGVPIGGVTVCATDLETEKALPVGETGMLLVSGPTVFPGYIGYEGPPPFRELDGKRWYVTGDLAEIGTDGYIRFRGRLKRFLKAGGEMISLPALEEPFARLYPATQEGPRVAVEGIETPSGRRIVLFTTEDIPLKEANAILQREGHRGIMRLDEVRNLEAIPVLGTGKTDYKVLRAMIEGERTGERPGERGA